ncbi:hypothetical protein ACH5RR_030802 [Cinchona calisaya]|uniref:Uncharacterized protein n=1 Tax=Cinchona calisaya TaxID=153742 RepID=A0ABD2YVP4_9GENT
MKVEIEIIRTETIKPSSPTPNHLQNYQLSFTDLTSSTLVIPIILCYPSNNQCTNSDTFNHLQESLSKALTLYYPLAGRIIDNSHVNCDDSGVPLVETRVQSELLEIIKDSEVGEIVNNFLPSGWDVPSGLPLVIQANFFKCGGLAIGLGFSHKIGDVPSFMRFIHYLAAIARNESYDKIDLHPPKFDSATLFPPKDLSSNTSHGGVQKLDIVTKRFVFGPSSIRDLKKKYADTNIDDDHHDISPPTKVEAVSAFVWSRLMASIEEINVVDQQPTNPGKMFLLANAMDLQKIADPPIPEYIFGNMGWISMTMASGKDLEKGGFGLVIKMREAFKDVANAGIVAKLKESDFDVFKETYAKFSNPSNVACVTSSFCGFGLYEADFGWGKPVWVASATFPVKNAVILMDGNEDGVEVWVNLIREDMAKFEVDKVFLSLVSSPN